MSKPNKAITKKQSTELSNSKETDKLLPNKNNNSDVKVKATSNNIDVDFLEDEVEEKGLPLV